MIIELKYPLDTVFSSELEEIVFSTDAVSAEFCLKMGEEVILQENYVPDSNGQIAIYDLQQLIEPHLRSNLVESFSYTIADSDGSTSTRTFVVQFCTADSPMLAQSFLEAYFLSTLMGEKITSIGRKEFVHLVASSSCTVQAVCTYWNDGALSNNTVVIKEIEEFNKVITVDVSPDLFVEDGKHLVKYEVQAGERMQIFVIDEDSLDVAPALLFTNSFGCQETFYCTGTQELNPQFSRSASLMGGMYRNFFVEETREFSANTGILNVPMSIWADDLFRSKEVYLLQDNLPGKEITITESDSKRNNDFDSIFCYSFKYRYAQRNHNILQTPKAGRVFDFTFDNTFA